MAVKIGPPRGDIELCDRVERDVIALLPGHHTIVRVSVRDGVVLLVGRVEYRGELAGIERLVRAVPGVVEVCNRISFLWDDEVR